MSSRRIERKVSSPPPPPFPLELLVIHVMEQGLVGQLFPHYTMYLRIYARMKELMWVRDYDKIAANTNDLIRCISVATMAACQDPDVLIRSPNTEAAIVASTLSIALVAALSSGIVLPNLSQEVNH